MHINSLKEANSTIEKLQNYLPESAYILQELYKEGPHGSFVSLNHGDCWNNNMMFKINGESGKITDHIFVDLQVGLIPEDVYPFINSNHTIFAH